MSAIAPSETAAPGRCSCSAEQLFGPCYLLGISFMPRFKDIADVRSIDSTERDRTDRWTPSCDPSRPRSFPSAGTRSCDAEARPTLPSLHDA